MGLAALHGALDGRRCTGRRHMEGYHGRHCETTKRRHTGGMTTTLEAPVAPDKNCMVVLVHPGPESTHRCVANPRAHLQHYGCCDNGRASGVWRPWRACNLVSLLDAQTKGRPTVPKRDALGTAEAQAAVRDRPQEGHHPRDNGEGRRGLERREHSRQVCAVYRG